VVDANVRDFLVLWKQEYFMWWMQMCVFVFKYNFAPLSFFIMCVRAEKCSSCFLFRNWFRDTRNNWLVSRDTSLGQGPKMVSRDTVMIPKMVSRDTSPNPDIRSRHVIPTVTNPEMIPKLAKKIFVRTALIIGIFC